MTGKLIEWVDYDCFLPSSFTALGYNVHYHERLTDEVIAHIASASPDIVVTELGFYDTQGKWYHDIAGVASLIAAVRLAQPALPIISCSCVADSYMQQHFLRLSGEKRIVQKPASVDKELLPLISKYVARSRIPDKSFTEYCVAQFLVLARDVVNC